MIYNTKKKTEKHGLTVWPHQAYVPKRCGMFPIGLFCDRVKKNVILLETFDDIILHLQQ